MKRRLRWLLPVLVLAAGTIYFLATSYQARRLVLTGVVTTDDVVVGSELTGRLQELRVREGDTVQAGELLALVRPQEWAADLAFAENTARQSAAQVTAAEADLRYQEAQTAGQIAQAEASLAASLAQVTAAEADLENARLNFERETDLHKQGTDSPQAFDLARTTFDGAKARVESLRRQSEAAQAAVALARANTEQTAVRQANRDAGAHQLAAAEAQRDKARVQFGETEIRAPIAGVVDVRAARPGEVVAAGQAVVTLIDPDNLWVRVDVEESYIDRIRPGDKVTVRLPSRAERAGTVFYRRVDADYATQRDVSRTKRDIRTFEVRVRCDNRDRSLAVGMTAYVTLPLAGS
jgi:HlyD family secretion protein